MPELTKELPPLFLANDAEEHRRLRSLANRAFSERSVRQINEHIHRLTEELLDVGRRRWVVGHRA